MIDLKKNIFKSQITQKAINISFVLLLLTLASCKPEDPPIPVPVVSTPSSASCQDFVFAGFPREEQLSDHTFFMCKQGYALNFNPTNKTSLWVAEKLESENINSPPNHEDIQDFRPEQLIPARLHSKNSDYIGTGYDRGQFAPSENFLYNDIRYSHSFYLTNVFPLHFERIELWNDINETIRQIASQRDLFVISGPVYLNGVGNGWIGQSSSSGRNSRRGMVHVPSHVYKVLIDPNTNQSIALVMENGTASNPLTTISVLELEEITGIRFLPDLPTAKSREISSQNNWSNWINN